MSTYAIHTVDGDRWQLRADSLTKWQVRQWLRKLYGDGWDRETITVHSSEFAEHFPEAPVCERQVNLF